MKIEATPCYHVISRCVRRAFLCGPDRPTGNNFDHRQSWISEKLARLCQIFAVRTCAYGVLSNHPHLVLHIDSERARGWSDEQVVACHGKPFRRSQKQWEKLPAVRRVARWRARRSEPSWFMRGPNESIARRANQEDGCTSESLRLAASGA